MAFIYKNPYQLSFEAAKQELAELTKEQQALSVRLEWLTKRQTQLAAYLSTAAQLIEEDPGQDLGSVGITEMCRTILSKTQAWMTAQEVREYLARMGVSIDGYTNPMAVLHSILKRVAVSKRDQDGEMIYGAPGPTPPLPHSKFPQLTGPDAPPAVNDGPPPLKGPDQAGTGFLKLKKK